MSEVSFFLILFIYLFLFLAASGLCCGMQDLSLRRTGFSLVVARGLQGVWALYLWHVGSRVHGLCSLQHVGSLVEAHGLGSCGAPA